MNQTFKMTAIAAALAVASGVAVANQFEATSSNVTSYASLLAGTSGVITPIIVNEIGTSIATVDGSSKITYTFPAGTVITLPTGVAAAAGTAVTGMTNIAANAGAATTRANILSKATSAAYPVLVGTTTTGGNAATNDDSVAVHTATSSPFSVSGNVLTVTLTDNADLDSNTATETLKTATGDTSFTKSNGTAVLTLAGVSVTLPTGTKGDVMVEVDSPNIVGFTKQSIKVANASDSAFGVFHYQNGSTTAVSTYPSYAVGTANIALANDIVIKEATAATNFTTAKTVTLKLSGGAKWMPSTVFTGAATDGGSATVFVRDSDVAATYSTDMTELTFTVDNGNASSADAETLTLDLSQVKVDFSGATAGDLNITVSSNESGFVTQTVKVGTIATKGASAAIDVTQGTDAAVAEMATLFTGRKNQSAKEAIKITEAAPGSLTASGTVVATLNAGTWDSGTIVDQADNSGFGKGSDFVASVTGKALGSQTNSITAVWNTTTTAAAADYIQTQASNALNLATMTTPGDLTVTLSGTAGVSSSAIKVADVKDASSVSTSGALPNVIKGATAVALPDIIITESQKAALAAGKIGFQVTASGVTLDTSKATVTKVSGDGAVNATVATGNFAYDINADGSAADDTTSNSFEATVSSASSATPLQFKISGVTLTASSTATSGDVVLYFGAQNVSATAADDRWDTEAKATRGSIKVASVVSDVNPSYPTVTVADTTKAVLAGIPLVAAGNDQGKQGAIYVAFIYNGTVFFMDNAQTWKLYTGATPAAYATGTLGSASIDVLKTATDLSSLKGGQLIVGYGLGIAGLGDPFKNMLDNVRYNVAYEVK